MILSNLCVWSLARDGRPACCINPKSRAELEKSGDLAGPPIALEHRMILGIDGLRATENPVRYHYRSGNRMGRIFLFASRVSAAPISLSIAYTYLQRVFTCTGSQTPHGMHAFSAFATPPFQVCLRGMAGSLS